MAEITQNSGNHYTYDDSFILKDTTKEQPSGRDAQGRGNRVQYFPALSRFATLAACQDGHSPELF